MAASFHVKDTSNTDTTSTNNTEYVLKMYPGDLLNCKAYNSGFLNKELMDAEIQQLTRLSHPNIVSLVEVSEVFVQSLHYSINMLGMASSP